MAEGLDIHYHHVVERIDWGEGGSASHFDNAVIRRLGIVDILANLSAFVKPSELVGLELKS